MAAFSAEGFEPRYIEKGDEGDSCSVDEAILIAGGDGTVKRALDLFGRTDRRFAILPLGGANNIATALGLPVSIPAIARMLREGQVRPFRMGLLRWPEREESFAEAVGAGALAQSMFEAKARKERLAGEDFDKIAVGRESVGDILAGAPPMETAVAIDGSPLPHDILFAEALNVGVTGPSLRLAESVPPDAQITVAFLRESSREEFRDALARGGPLPVELRTGAEVTFKWKGHALRVDDVLLAPPESPVSLHICRSQQPSAMMVTPQDETP